MLKIILVCKTNIYNIYCYNIQANNRIEWYQKLGHQLVRFEGYEAVLKSPDNDSREYYFIVIMESILVFKVYL